MSWWKKPIVADIAAGAAGAIVAIFAYQVREKYLLRREESARELKWESETYRLMAEQGKLVEEKKKEYERRVQLSRTPLTKLSDNSSNNLSGTFWNRKEVMHSILFPLIRFAMEDKELKSRIVKSDWIQKYETVPLKVYRTHKMFNHPIALDQLIFHNWDLSTGIFEVEYKWHFFRSRDLVKSYKLKCYATSLRSTSLRIVFESNSKSNCHFQNGGGELTCWEIPIVLPRPLQPAQQCGNSSSSSASESTDISGINHLCAAVGDSHVELAKLLDPTKVSNEQFDRIFGANLVSLLKSVDAICKYHTHLPTALRQLAFEYTN